MKTITQKIGLLAILIGLAAFTSFAQNITGKIIDKDGEPLVGATVQIKGAKFEKPMRF